MYKKQDTPCRKCGGETKIEWIPSSGMDIELTGMEKICNRCGFSEILKEEVED